MAENNPLEQLLGKEIVTALHQKGQLGDFLRDYYRILQLRIHPDRGGSTELSSRINSAYDAVRKANGSLGSLVDSMDSSSAEYLQAINALADEVERLKNVENDYEELRKKYAEALSGKVKAEKVRTPSGRKARVTEEESFTAEEPRVRTPPRAGARTTAEPEPEPTIPVEPIILPDVILYDAKGKAFHKYKKVTVSGESIKTASGYVMKTQDEWTAFYADKREKNISLPLFYAVLERLVDEKHPALAGLAKDLKDSYLSMGTRINYDKDFIIHNYGTPDAETFHCPLPASDWMETAKGTKAGKNAFKAFLMAKDVDKADEVLRKVCGVKPYLWTPDAENRKAVPERAVFVYANSVWLSLGCGSYLGDHGRSRSVVVE